MRGGNARAPSGGDLLAIKRIAGSPSEPGCAARSPGFLLPSPTGFPVAALRRAPRPERPAGGIGIRACLRNTLLRVRIPGGVPDLLLRERELVPLFYNLDVAKQAPPRATCPR